MRSLVWAALAVCAAAQQPAPQAKAALTAEQIIDKSVEATGGRAAIEKLTSTWARGTMEFISQEVRGTMELYAKAPGKQLVIMNLDAVGEIRQGFNGREAWGQDPSGRITELTGAALADMQRGAVFNAAIKWRELYPKVELQGVETIEGRKAYVVLLTPATGSPLTRYFDAETFLMLREAGRRDTPQGPMEIRADFSDYREVSGVKTPFVIRQAIAMGEVVLRISEMKNNLEIDDSRFAKPQAGKQ